MKTARLEKIGILHCRDVVRPPEPQLDNAVER